MRRFALVCLLIFYSTSSTLAQNACGSGLPCGPVPWPLQEMPALVSPSPFPTFIVMTATLTPTSGPSPTFTPSITPSPTVTPSLTFTPSVTPTIATITPYPTSTPFVDLTEISGQIATVQAIMNATAVPIEDDPGDINTELGTNAGSFFAYIRGLADANFGVLTPMIVFLLTSFTFILVVKAAQLFMPLVAIGFGFLRKLVELILGFIPG